MIRNAPNPPSAPTAYSSLGLKALLRLLEEGRAYTILDLGPALSANVEFWSGIPCRLHVEDFYFRYRERTAGSSDDAAEPAFQDILSFSEGTRFDMILAWDLFNYLDLNEIGYLIQRLAPLCGRGALLFALVSSQVTIPAEPQRFRILDAERLTVEIRSLETRQNPRHQPRDIAKILSGFRVSSSFLLRNGVQEYVFVYGE